MAQSSKGTEAPSAELRPSGNLSLLEGSVRRAGDRLRLGVQLIDVADGCHLWSQTYERTMTDSFAVQDELSGLIAGEVRGVLARLGAPVASSHPGARG